MPLIEIILVIALFFYGGMVIIALLHIVYDIIKVILNKIKETR